MSQPRPPGRLLARDSLARALPWLWLPLWVAAALIAIFQHGPMPMYSTRTLSVAWEMWLHHSILVPYLNGLPYSDKPPLLLWLIQSGWSVAGVNDVWPRLLEVALGAIQLVLAWRLARTLFPQDKRIAHATAWILLAFTYGFLFGLQVMYEVLLADCVLAALLCLAPAAHGKAPHFGGFLLALSLGLLTKGPVVVLHVGLPWLLGPLWSEWARRERRLWYGRGGLSLLAACVVLLAWALPAARIGGEAYQHRLLVHQTAGRVVDAFAHAHPYWWYLPLLPVLAFPFTLWPRLWAALLHWRQPLDSGARFLLAWLLPVLLGFSVISGKQAYYLLPEFGGMAMLMAVVLERAHASGEANSRWLAPWPLAVLLAATGSALIGLDALVAHHVLSDPIYLITAPHGRPFGVLCLLLALLLVVPRKGELHRVAGVGLVAAVAANGLFSLTLWPAYDFMPVSKLVAKAQQEGRPVASLESNDGQYAFLGRLTQPVEQLHSTHALLKWADQHADGLVIVYPKRLSQADRAQAVYIQPFRGISLAVWLAPALAKALPQEDL
ncbi:ArnT family glycosyltransferase [Rhodanobacter geophilus]|uniref:ArnT family glycosyltransferase n=1 Tax=Rhodanobacter geophilus TaxID=3162488 RepID=A0ABV3QPX0_9GAMM